METEEQRREIYKQMANNDPLILELKRMWMQQLEEQIKKVKWTMEKDE